MLTLTGKINEINGGTWAAIEAPPPDDQERAILHSPPLAPAPPALIVRSPT